MALRSGSQGRCFRAGIARPPPAPLHCCSAATAGPRSGTFLLASVANRNCPRRFLGAAAGCGPARLRLYDGYDRRAALVWRLAP